MSVNLWKSALFERGGWFWAQIWDRRGHRPPTTGCFRKLEWCVIAISCGIIMIVGHYSGFLWVVIFAVFCVHIQQQLEIYSKLSGNFRKFVNCLCQSAVSKSSIAKWCCKISMFLTNNYSGLYTLTLCIMFSENNLFLARLLGISANLSEIIDVITSRLLLIHGGHHHLEF